MFGRLATLPIFSIALWAGLVLLFVATLFAIRSRWGRNRPIYRCVLLSFAAHLVLVAIAASVHFASLPPGNGWSEPVRISIVAKLPTSDLVQADAPVKLVEPEQEPEQQIVETPTPTPQEVEVAPEVLPVEVASDSPLPEAPELLAAPAPPAPTPTPAAKPPESTPSADSAPPQFDAAGLTAATPTTPDMSRAAAVAAVPVETPASAAPSPAAPPAPMAEGAVPSEFADRVRPDRLQSVIEQGGSPETEQAVGRALEWLAYAQGKDGRWEASRWEAGREQFVLQHNRNGAGRDADTGISALALLSFLGAGHTHLEGGYRQTVTDGLNFLIRSQGADGNLYGNATQYAKTYCHSMATFALSEAYALTGDRRLEPSVRRAVEFLVRTQHAPSGGWRYHPGQVGDVSQLGWIVMALRSAEIAGVEVPDLTWHRAEHFLSTVVRGRHGGLAAYQPSTLHSTTMTAEAMYCRQILGRPLAGAAQEEALQLMLTELPGSSKANFYYWYYATLTLHHAQRDSSMSASAWSQWNEALKRELLTAQVSDGSNSGSWSPNTVWGGYGGRVYSTAMATMCLEVYYRFRSEEGDQAPWVAGRPRGVQRR